jgi:cytochrome c553
MSTSVHDAPRAVRMRVHTVLRGALACALACLGFLGVACAQWGGAEIPTTWQFATHEHFLRSPEIRQSLIRGDLEGARRAAQDVAEHADPTELPASAVGLLDETRARALELSQASSIAEAASASARMAASCGACHAEGDVGPRYLLGAPPATIVAADRHGEALSWSVTRLWQGLVAPSDSAWGLGIQGLESTPIAEEQLETLGIEASWAEPQLSAFQDLVREAHAPRMTQDRVAFFARVLTTCANCHEAFP